MPFVLYFVTVVGKDLETDDHQEQEQEQETRVTYSAENPNVQKLDDIGEAFFLLKMRNNGLYDVVANLSWVADGVNEVENGPAMLLIKMSLDEPDTAIRFIEMPWFNDDLTEEEAWVFLRLRHIDSFATDASAQTSRLTWVVDGVNDFEFWAIISLSYIFDESPNAANTLISKPWFKDGITENEADVIGLLGALSYTTGSASMFISMPFMESVEEADVLSLDALYRLALLNRNTLTAPSEFEKFISHPVIANGITDETTVFVTLAGNAYKMNPGLIDTLLDPHKIMPERRTILLPLAGEVDLVIVRTRPGSERSLDLLEQSVRFTESYMGEPFPVNLVLLLYADALQPGFLGHNSGTNIVVHPDFDRDDGRFEAYEAEIIIMHEVAHYYWRGSSHSWLNEGAAEFLSIVYAEGAMELAIDEILTTVFLDDYDCANATNMKSLEEMPSREATKCAYNLGLLFFMDLHNNLGTEEFQRGFRELYLKGKDVSNPNSPESRGVNHVREAFQFSSIATEEIIPKWLEDRS